MSKPFWEKFHPITGYKWKKKYPSQEKVSKEKRREQGMKYRAKQKLKNKI